MYKIPDTVKNKFEFVTLAAKRAEQLQMGAIPRVENPSTKVTVVAQDEVASGLVSTYDPEAAAEAQIADEEEE